MSGSTYPSNWIAFGAPPIVSWVAQTDPELGTLKSAFCILNFAFNARHLHSPPVLPRPLRLLPVRDLDEHRPAGRLHGRARARDRGARKRGGGRHDLFRRGDAVADVAPEPDPRRRRAAVVV